MKKDTTETGDTLLFLEKLLEQRTKNLHNLAEELNLLIESIPVVPYECSANRVIGTKYIHKSVKNITGFSPAEFIADPDFWSKRIHPKDTKRVLGKFKELKSGEKLTIEYRWQIADGSYRLFSDYMQPDLNKKGEPICIRGYWQDITERKAGRPQTTTP